MNCLLQQLYLWVLDAWLRASHNREYGCDEFPFSRDFWALKAILRAQQ
jgi:hypothetical protein